MHPIEIGPTCLMLWFPGSSLATELPRFRLRLIGMGRSFHRFLDHSDHRRRGNALYAQGRLGIADGKRRVWVLASERRLRFVRLAPRLVALLDQARHLLERILETFLLDLESGLELLLASHAGELGRAALVVSRTLDLVRLLLDLHVPAQVALHREHDSHGYFPWMTTKPVPLQCSQSFLKRFST